MESGQKHIWIQIMMKQGWIPTTNQIKNQVYDQVLNQVCSQVVDQLYGQVWNYGSMIRNAIATEFKIGRI